MTLSPAITGPSPQVIGCTRLSTAVQELGYGQEAQITDINSYARKNGLTISSFVHEVMSGAAELEARDVVQEYYQLARAFPGTSFIFPRVDRLGRLAERIITIARALINHKASVYIVGFDKPLDPKAPDWMMFQLKAMLAEQSYLGILQRTMSGRIAKAEANGWPSGRPPWGYRLTRDERGKALLPELHPERAPAVRRLFELRADLGSDGAGRIMRQEGWPPPSSTTTWTRDAVRRITNNFGYTGNWTFGAITIQIPPIVTVEMYEAVQRNNRERFIHRGPRAEHLLSGVAYCAACGAAMSRTATSTKRLPAGTQHRWYYRCWRIRSDRQKCTQGPYYLQPDLEAMVWAAFVSTATDPVKLQALLTEVKQVEPSAAFLAQQSELDAAVARAWEPYTRGVPGVTFEMAQAASAPYVAQKNRLLEQQPIVLPVINVEAVASKLAELLHQPMTAEGQRNWLKTLHVKAYVSKSGIDQLTMNLPKV